jgi:hypothetical protein
MKPIIGKNNQLVGLQMDMFSTLKIVDTAAPAAPAPAAQPQVQHFAACPLCGEKLKEVIFSTDLGDLFGGSSKTAYTHCPNPECKFDQIGGIES